MTEEIVKTIIGVIFLAGTIWVIAKLVFIVLDNLAKMFGDE